jgi:hypothetical protein
MTQTAIGRNRERVETELGTEIRCSKCRDFFPADGEFFYSTNGMYSSWCKACHTESTSQVERNERRKAARRKSAETTPTTQGNSHG